MTTAALLSESPRRPRRGLRVALWAVQVLLAVAFGMAGFMKITMPMSELSQKLVWPGALPEAFVRFIGAAELAAALGLILPGVTRVRPGATPLAAAGLAVIMLLAIFFHLSRGEARLTPINFILGGLAAFVAWGRLPQRPADPAGLTSHFPSRPRGSRTPNRAARNDHMSERSAICACLDA